MEGNWRTFYSVAKKKLTSRKTLKKMERLCEVGAGKSVWSLKWIRRRRKKKGNVPGQLRQSFQSNQKNHVVLIQNSWTAKPWTFVYLYLVSSRLFRKVKVKLSLCLTKHHAMKAYWGSGGMAPLILWPRHEMEVSGQLHALAALPPGKEPLVHIG
jgi:hypothetical protein